MGDVRLDNRDEMADRLGLPADGVTDLCLVLAALECEGASCVAKLLGDFSFAAWDGAAGELIAARDAFGVKTLFYRQIGDELHCASHASLLAGEHGYNLQFIADYLVLAKTPGEPNPFAGASTLPSGCMLRARNASLSVTRYWSADDFELQDEADPNAAIEQFRTLLRQAVRTRLTGRADTWAQLSGGLDSSSVVCVAQLLAREGIIRTGLTGTISLVSPFGDGDESIFSDAVAHQCQVPNEQVTDTWLWQDDGLPPPLTDAPTNIYPLYAQHRRVVEIVRRAGGSILLTGSGSDHYLYGTGYYLADWLVQGRWRDVVREAMHTAMLRRGSVWRVGLENVVAPLLPSRLRKFAVPQYCTAPPWIDRRLSKAYNLSHAHGGLQMLAGRIGRKYAGAIVWELTNYGCTSNLTPLEEAFDVRHPFLFRPLVEYCLRLPPVLRTRPLQEKWILRQAMRGILPEAVRARTSKGGLDSCIAWSLSHERERVDDLATNPLLAELGCIDPAKLRRGIEEVRNGHQSHVVAVVTTLALETWLRVRSGRWTVRQSALPRALRLA